MKGNGNENENEMTQRPDSQEEGVKGRDLSKRARRSERHKVDGWSLSEEIDEEGEMR